MISIFHQYAAPTPQIIDLLTQTTLGTNGARYQLLNTPQRIQHLGKATYLTIERNNRTLANVTFCTRGKHQYLRYLAFDEKFQAGSKKISSRSGLLKNWIQAYLDDAFESGNERFYAYVDPKNQRSVHMTEQFGFQKTGTLVTQTFSRKSPKLSSRHLLLKAHEIPETYWSTLRKQKHFFNDYSQQGTYHALADASGNLLAIAHADQAAWKIKRLPGKFGRSLVQLMPKIPVLKHYIRPEHHAFCILDGLVVLKPEEHLLAELFESILAHYQLPLLHWWVDALDSNHVQYRKSIKWGVMDKIIGQPEVAVYELGKPALGSTFYVSGYDLT